MRYGVSWRITESPREHGKEELSYKTVGEALDRCKVLDKEQPHRTHGVIYVPENEKEKRWIHDPYRQEPYEEDEYEID